MKNPRPMSTFVIIFLILFPILIIFGFYHKRVTPEAITTFLENLDKKFYDYRILRTISSEEPLKTLKKKHSGSPVLTDKNDIRIFDTVSADSRVNKDIVLVTIDEKTLTQLDQWPIRRDNYGHLLNRIFQDGKAAGFVFDVVFSERGDYGLLQKLQELKTQINPSDSEKINLFIDQVDYDAVLLNAIGQNRDYIIGGYATLSSAEEAATKHESNNFFLRKLYRYHTTDITTQQMNSLSKAFGGTYNYFDLRSLLKYRGYFTFPYDKDGVLRTCNFLQRIPVNWSEKKADMVETGRGLLEGLLENNIIPPEKETTKIITTDQIADAVKALMLFEIFAKPYLTTKPLTAKEEISLSEAFRLFETVLEPEQAKLSKDEKLKLLSDRNFLKKLNEKLETPIDISEYIIEKEFQWKDETYGITSKREILFGALALETYFMSNSAPGAFERGFNITPENEWLIVSEVATKNAIRKSLNTNGKAKLKKSLINGISLLPDSYSPLQKQLLQKVIEKQLFLFTGNFSFLIKALNSKARGELDTRNDFLMKLYTLTQEELLFRKYFMKNLTPEEINKNIDLLQKLALGDRPAAIFETLSTDEQQNIKSRLKTDIEKTGAFELMQEILNERLGHLFEKTTENLAELLREALHFVLKYELQAMYSFKDGKDKQVIESLLNSININENFIKEHFSDELVSDFRAVVRMNEVGDAGIDFKAGPMAYLRYSMIDVLTKDRLSGELFGFPTPEQSLRDAFENKIVFFGPTAHGINDWRVSPISQRLDGVEAHAHLFDTLRTETQIFRTGNVASLEVFLLLVLAFTVPFFIRRLNASYGALFSLFLLVLLYGFSHNLFYGANIQAYSGAIKIILLLIWAISLYGMKKIKARKMSYFITTLLLLCCFAALPQLNGYRIYFQVVPFLLLLLSQYIFLATYEFVLEEKERKKTRSAFQNYVNASVVNAVLSDPEMLKLGGQKREMTCLFSDVRGFTTISEKLEPQTLVSLMNEYLEEMTDLVMQYDGTLDKFIGDAVMAFWGAPIAQKNHAELATITAIEMNKRVAILYGKLLEKYGVEVRIGIGINTGPMVVGNMGSKTRFNYTVLGDAVNLGARLEGQTKNYGAELILSQSSYDLVRDWAATRFLDLIAVKGKAEPVRIYECIGRKNEMTEKVLKGLAEFEEAIHDYYLGRKFKEGIEVFESLKCHRNGKDAACDLYIKRCRDFMENPPDESWNGVFVATSK